MTSLGDVPIERPGLVLLVALLVSVVSVFGAGRIEPRVDFVDTVPPGPEVDAYRSLVERLDGVRFVALYQSFEPESGWGSLRTDAGFDALVRQQAQLTRDLGSRFPGAFSHSLSVYEAMRAGHYMFQKVATGGNAPPESYSVPNDPAMYAAVRDRVRAENVADVLAADGSSAIALFFFTTKDNFEARRLSGEVAEFAADWAPEEQPVTRPPQASGLHYSSHYVDERNGQEMRRWAWTSTAAVAVVLLFALRRASSVLITLGTLGLGLLWTFGLMGGLGIRVSFLTVFLAPLVIGVGVDYPLHLLHRYEEERGAGVPWREALRRSVRGTGSAVAVAAATTIAGLGVLVLVPAPLFSEIGLVGALGIALSLLACFTVAPALRALLPERRGARMRRDALGSGSGGWAVWVRRHPTAAALFLVFVLGGAGLIAATGTRVESGSAENEFPADDPVLRLQQRIEHEYGAFQRAYLIVEGDAAQPGVLRAIHRAVNASRSLPLFHRASSVTNLLVADAKTDQGFADSLFGAATRPGDESYLPATASEARGALERLFRDPLWRSLAPFVITRDYTLTVVAIQLRPTGDQGDLVALRDALRALAAALAREAGPAVSVHAAGAPVNRAAVLEQTPWDVAIATLGSGVAVFGVLSVAWRRRGREGVRLALVSTGIVLGAALLLVASVPVLDAVYAASAGAGVPANRASLSDMFLLAFALTVAVGVDGAVHVVARYWEERDRTGLPQVAFGSAFAHSGRAVVMATATTVVPFVLLSGAYFLQSRNLAILTALGALFATMLTFVALPLALRSR